VHKLLPLFFKRKCIKLAQSCYSTHKFGHYFAHFFSKELDDGSDDRVFLVKTMVAFFRIVAALTHNECTGVACW
jgi:hypothetical protein